LRLTVTTVAAIPIPTIVAETPGPQHINHSQNHSNFMMGVQRRFGNLPEAYHEKA
jgi:hypothetical protein